MLLTAAASSLSIPLADGSVQVACGSPPYQGLRFYGKKGDDTTTGAAWVDWPAVEWSPLPGEPARTAPPWRGQLGHEPDPGLYVAHLVAICREVRRVLHETGCLWLNIGTTMGRPQGAALDAPPGGTSGTGSLDSPGHDSLSTHLCGACAAIRQRHTEHTSTRLSPGSRAYAVDPTPGRTASHCPSPENSDSLSQTASRRSRPAIPVAAPTALPGAAHAPGAQASTSPGSSSPPPGGCWHCDNCGACLSVLGSSSRDARLCGRRGGDLGTAGTSPPPHPSGDRRSDTGFSSSAWGDSTTAYQPGQDIGVPWRVAFALQADGWILRSAVTWEANRLPQSVTGWRWERCRLKVAAAGTDGKTYDGLGAEHSRREYNPAIGGYQYAAPRWAPCPGCPKCEANPLPCPLCISQDVPATIDLLRASGNPTDWARDNWLDVIAPWISDDPSSGILDVDGQECPICAGDRTYGGLVLRRGSWRPTSSTEMVFMFAKGPGYWASGEGVREAMAKITFQQEQVLKPYRQAWAEGSGGRHQSASGGVGRPAAGRNLRDVWRPELTEAEAREHFEAIGRAAVGSGELSDLWYIATEPSRLAHYAGWPSALARRMIQSSTPDAGCCRDCGVPWSEVVERETSWSQQQGATKTNQEQTPGAKPSQSTALGHADRSSSVLGWLPSCTCHPLPPAPLTVAEARRHTRPSRVLDMFGGTGTTAKTARAMGRDAVSLDPILEYCAMARDKAGEGCVDALSARGRTLKEWAAGDDAQMGLFG